MANWLAQPGRLIALFYGLLLASSYASSAVPNPPLTICVDDACTNTPAPSTSQIKGVRFHPGHYIWVMPVMTQAKLDSGAKQSHFQQIAALANEPSIQGIQLHVVWGLLEGPKAGDYSQGFALVDEYLSRLKAVNKRLMLVVHERLFGAYGPSALAEGDYFPIYLKDSKYNGGWIETGGSPYVSVMTRLWDPPVMDRMIALSQAYGARYNSNPTMEMFSPFEESSINVPTSSGYTGAGMLTQLKRLYTATRIAWPNTALRLKTNWFANDSQFQELIAHLAKNGVAMGGPDILPNEEVQANKIFNGVVGGVDYRGVVPWVSEDQGMAFCGKEGNYTPEQIYNHAIEGNATKKISASRPQYFVWTNGSTCTDPAKKWATGGLPFIRSISGKVTSGTNTTRLLPVNVPCVKGYTCQSNW